MNALLKRTTVGATPIVRTQREATLVPAKSGTRGLQTAADVSEALVIAIHASQAMNLQYTPFSKRAFSFASSVYEKSYIGSFRKKDIESS